MKITTVLALTLALASSCGPNTLKQDATNVETSIGSCAKADLTKLVGADGLTILADVARALTDTSTPTGWSTVLSDLETKVGGPLVGCAVDAVKQVFSTFATTARPSTSSGAPIAATVIERAETYAKKTTK